MDDRAPIDLARSPIHLGLGATAAAMEEFDGTPEWFGRYAQRVEADGVDGRLVLLVAFTEDWDVWEVHPHGAEVVVCVDGEIVLHQDIGGEVRSLRLRPGQAAVNPPGVWHTADVADRATALFITAGQGTENRPR